MSTVAKKGRGEHSGDASRAELQDALREAERAREVLESANRAKDRFLAVLSHELRTPLSPILVAAEIIRKRSDLPADLRVMADMIHRNVRIEVHLIDDLLDLTRISRGALEIVRAPTDVHGVIQRALEVCEADIKGREQRVTLSFDAEATVVEGDDRRLQQLFWNVLKNASKFSPAQGHIQVRTMATAGRLRVEVQDNGIGIAPEMLPRIFNAFTQEGEWISREFGGLGLGLAIARATAAAHGGALTAESAGHGHGATFILELPLPRS